MYVDSGVTTSNLMQLKNQLISNEIDGNNLPSGTIRELMDVLDWTIEPEKRIIIYLCKIVSKRGDIDTLTNGL